MSKISPSDFRVGCKPPSNIVELIQTYLDFEKDLEEFEYSFEQDGHIKCWKKFKKQNLCNLFFVKNEKLIFEMINFIIIGMWKPPFITNWYKMCENWHWKTKWSYFLQIFETLLRSLKDEKKKKKKNQVRFLNPL